MSEQSIEDRIVGLLREREELTIDDITNSTDRSKVAVRKALKRLAEENKVKCTLMGRTIQYSVMDPATMEEIKRFIWTIKRLDAHIEKLRKGFPTYSRYFLHFANNQTEYYVDILEDNMKDEKTGYKAQKASHKRTINEVDRMCIKFVKNLVLRNRVLAYTDDSRTAFKTAIERCVELARVRDNHNHKHRESVVEHVEGLKDIMGGLIYNAEIVRRHLKDAKEVPGEAKPHLDGFGRAVEKLEFQRTNLQKDLESVKQYVEYYRKNHQDASTSKDSTREFGETSEILSGIQQNLKDFKKKITKNIEKSTFNQWESELSNAVTEAEQDLQKNKQCLKEIPDSITT